MTDRCWQLHLICRRGPESRDSYILIQSDAKPDPVVYRTYTRGRKTAARHDRGRRHSETLKKYSEDTQLHDKYSEMNRNTVSEDVTNVQYQISLCFQSKIALLWLDPTVMQVERHLCFSCFYQTGSVRTCSLSRGVPLGSILRPVQLASVSPQLLNLQVCSGGLRFLLSLNWTWIKSLFLILIIFFYPGQTITNLYNLLISDHWSPPETMQCFSCSWFFLFGCVLTLLHSVKHDI